MEHELFDKETTEPIDKKVRTNGKYCQLKCSFLINEYINGIKYFYCTLYNTHTEGFNPLWGIYRCEDCLNLFKHKSDIIEYDSETNKAYLLITGKELKQIKKGVYSKKTEKEFEAFVDAL